MNALQIRKWLTTYLMITVPVLLVVFLLGQNWLPLREPEALDCITILIPTLIGQLALVVRWWFARGEGEDDHVQVPKILVMWPALVFVALVGFATIDIIWGNYGGHSWVMSTQQYKYTLATAIAFWNFTTGVEVATFFRPAGKSRMRNDRA